MEIKLTIQERLRDLRAERGLTLEQLANDTHISRSSLSSYESNEFKDISPFAIVTLAQFYGVSTDYLLGLSENKKHSDVDITSLHLNDEVLDLLRSGKINNRLLGEMILHKDFKRFLLDVEIVVDRIADSYVSSMGTFFSVIRKKFADKFHPDEDLSLRMLELTNIKEPEFFNHIFCEDMESIIHDIREAHLSDPTTAKDCDFFTVENAERQFELMCLDASDREKMTRAFSYATGIPRDKITDEDTDFLIRFLEKSPRFKNANNMRGKAFYHGKKKGKRSRK